MIVDRTTTAIVVDSTADLPEYLAGDPNISMVPLTVYFGEEAYLDWVELKPDVFYERLGDQPGASSYVPAFRRGVPRALQGLARELPARLFRAPEREVQRHHRERRGSSEPDRRYPRRRLGGRHRRGSSAGGQAHGTAGPGRARRGVRGLHRQVPGREDLLFPAHHPRVSVQGWADGTCLASHGHASQYQAGIEHRWRASSTSSRRSAA